MIQHLACRTHWESRPYQAAGRVEASASKASAKGKMSSNVQVICTLHNHDPWMTSVPVASLQFCWKGACKPSARFHSSVWQQSALRTTPPASETILAPCKNHWMPHQSTPQPGTSVIRLWCNGQHRIQPKIAALTVCLMLSSIQYDFLSSNELMQDGWRLMQLCLMEAREEVGSDWG